MRHRVTPPRGWQQLWDVMPEIVPVSAEDPIQSSTCERERAPSEECRQKGRGAIDLTRLTPRCRSGIVRSTPPKLSAFFTRAISRPSVRVLVFVRTVSVFLRSTTSRDSTVRPRLRCALPPSPSSVYLLLRFSFVAPLVHRCRRLCLSVWRVARTGRRRSCWSCASCCATN